MLKNGILKIRTVEDEGGVKGFAVEPAQKLAVTWGQINPQRSG